MKIFPIHYFKSIKLILCVFIVVLIFLQYELWFSMGGIVTFKQLSNTITKQKERINDLEHENQRLSLEISDLRHGHEMLESKARSQLGMVKSGETYYQLE